MANSTTAVDRLASLPTAAVSDALDRLGLPGALQGLTPLLFGQRACGPAFTVQYEPVDGGGGTVGDFLDDVPAGAVIVLDNRASVDCTVWGGIMTQLAFAKGIAGTVINGVCRDVQTVAGTGYPLWTAGRYMRTGKDRVRVAAVQHRVVIRGVRINPGDILCADEDGVVVVPHARTQEVADIAVGIEDVETNIVAAVKCGSTLREARTRFGYHTLQTSQVEQGARQ
jgi:regulator of RNase E activity RraA